MRYLILSMLFASLFATADERVHTVGAIVSTGTLYSSDDQFSNDELITLGAYYEYHFDSTYSVRGSYQDGGEACLIQCSNGPSTSFNSGQISLKASKKLPNSWWSLFGRVGINHYNIEYPYLELQHQPEKSISGTGGVFAIGTEFEAAKKVIIGVEVQYLPMKTNDWRSLSFTIGYPF